MLHSIFFAVALLTVLGLTHANAQDPPHPLVEGGFDPQLREGDQIEVSCSGDATAHGYLRLYDQRRWPDSGAPMDSFYVTGTVDIEVKSAKPSLHQLVNIPKGSLRDANRKETTELALDGEAHRSFAIPRLISTFGGDGFVQFPDSTYFRTKCDIKKYDPRQPRQLVGTFDWKFTEPYKKQLFFQANDVTFDDGKEYPVLGSDEAFAVIRTMVGKNVKVLGRVTASGSFEVDVKTMNLKEVPVLCNISVSYRYVYDTNGWNYGGLDGKYQHTNSYYRHDVPYSSAENAKEWTEYMCSWWNANPMHTGFKGTIQTWSSDYKCKTVCK